jgi:hypothetical protein
VARAGGAAAVGKSGSRPALREELAALAAALDAAFGALVAAVVAEEGSSHNSQRHAMIGGSDVDARGDTGLLGGGRPSVLPPMLAVRPGLTAGGEAGEAEEDEGGEGGLGRLLMQRRSFEPLAQSEGGAEAAMRFSQASDEGPGRGSLGAATRQLRAPLCAAALTGPLPNFLPARPPARPPSGPRPLCPPSVAQVAAERALQLRLGGRRRGCDQ